MSDLIIINDLVARYGDDTILDGVSFTVADGEIMVIVGGSGCGKSTLMRHMVGLNRPASGQILIDGIDIGAGDDNYKKILQKIGVLFQGGALFGSMTLGENVALPILEYTDLPHSAVSTLVRMKLCMVNLGSYENYLPSQISGGMKKRAALARALALNPQILFLDEPTAGLDPVTSAEIEDLILHINRHFDTTLVIVTHSLSTIFKVAHRVIMLDKLAKGIIAQGHPVELKTQSDNPRVRQFFDRQATEQLGSLMSDENQKSDRNQGAPHPLQQTDD